VLAQLAQADLVVVNKLDLAGGSESGELPAWLAEAAPAARLVYTVRAQLPAAVILGWKDGWRDGATTAAVASATVGSLPARRSAGRSAGRSASQQTPTAFAAVADGRWRRLRQPPGADFVSASFRFAQAVDPPRLARGLGDPALGVLRSKGLMRARDGTQVLLQQAGSRIELSNLRYPQPEHGRLVCIGLRHRLDRAAIDRVLEDAFDG
jgi:G3E family GTPase